MAIMEIMILNEGVGEGRGGGGRVMGTFACSRLAAVQSWCYQPKNISMT